MIAPLRISDLVKSYGGQLIGSDASFSGMSIDTRSLQPGDLFIAIAGEQVDGHQFLAKAKQLGAVGAVITSSCDRQPEQSYWQVDNAVDAMAAIAYERRAQYSEPLIGLTGSGGKTSVKAMIASILKATYGEQAVFATKGNLNNHLGVPLSLMSIDSNHRFAVIEMGASALGEIKQLTTIAKPTVGLVNNVMPAHVEGFGSIDNIAKGKNELYQMLDDNAVAVVNIDDHYAPLFLSTNQSRKVISFSCDGRKADVSAHDIQLSSQSVRYQLHIDHHIVSIHLPVPGRHAVANSLASAACTYAVGVDVNSIKQGLEAAVIDSGRLEVKAGFNNSQLIDDSYNANPGSMRAAVDVLVTQPGQSILIVGDMGELGCEAESMHRSVGDYAKQQGVDYMLSLGEFSQAYQQGFGHPTMAFNDITQLVSFTRSITDENTTILIKGSRGARMERVVECLTANEGVSLC